MSRLNLDEDNFSYENRRYSKNPCSHCLPSSCQPKPCPPKPCPPKPCPPSPYPPNPCPHWYVGPTGPTGATGATGPAGLLSGSYDTLDELNAQHPTGTEGEAYLVGDTLYVWDTATNSWKDAGNVVGPTGATGLLSGYYETLDELNAQHPTGTEGEAYLVGDTLYVWDTATNSWKNAGNVVGPTGATGPVGTILGSYDTFNQLTTEHPTGAQGDAYLVGSSLYVWNETEETWKNVGDLKGPRGITELQFNSIDGKTTITDTVGGRSVVIVIGIGGDDITAATDPISVPEAVASIKTFTGGTITDIHVVLSLTAGSIDATLSDLHVQLYQASGFTSKEFHAVPNTQMIIPIPSTHQSGAVYSETLRNISIEIEPESQLLIGFYLVATSASVVTSITAHFSGVIRME